MGVVLNASNQLSQRVPTFRLCCDRWSVAQRCCVPRNRIPNNVAYVRTGYPTMLLRLDRIPNDVVFVSTGCNMPSNVACVWTWCPTMLCAFQQDTQQCCVRLNRMSNNMRTLAPRMVSIKICSFSWRHSQMNARTNPSNRIPWYCWGSLRPFEHLHETCPIISNNFPGSNVGYCIRISVGSNSEANTCNKRQAQENAWKQFTIGFDSTSDWLRKWGAFSFN